MILITAVVRVASLSSQTGWRRSPDSARLNLSIRPFGDAAQVAPFNQQPESLPSLTYFIQS